MQSPELRPARQAGVIPCFGIGCLQHDNCRSYEAVRFSDPHSLRIGFCASDAQGKRVRFIPIRGAA
jgi:hypothetical protein